MTIAITTQARPYAKAAFEYALEQDDLVAWSNMLQVASMIASDKRVQDLLTNPRVLPQQLLSLFSEICGETIDEPRKNLLRLLVNKRRLNLLPEIANIFLMLQAERDQTVTVEMLSAFPLTDDQRNRFQQVLSKRLNRKVSLDCRIDESLMGGLVVRAKSLDLVIDGSVRGKLVEMAGELVE